MGEKSKFQMQQEKRKQIKTLQKTAGGHPRVEKDAEA